MPRVSVWAIRIALLYLVAGALVGSLLLAAKAVALPGWLDLLRAGPARGAAAIQGHLCLFLSLPCPRTSFPRTRESIRRWGLALREGRMDPRSPPARGQAPRG